MPHHTHTSLRRIGWIAGGFAMLFALTGCATYETQTQTRLQATKAGNFASAVSQADQQAKASTGSKDELVFRFEQGATLRSAALADTATVPDIRSPQPVPKKGDLPSEPLLEPTRAEVHAHYYTRSIEAFDQAEAKVNTWEEQAKVRVGSEVVALVTNQASLPYRGRAYDKVMMNTYKALNYLALGDADKARVELNRSLQRQSDAVEANQKRIASALDEAELARKGELKDEKGKSVSYDSDKAMNDARTGPALLAVLNESIAPMQPYGDYVNPFSVFLDGLYFTVLGQEGNDWERGRKSFERVAAMVPDNAFLQADLEAAARAAEGKAPEGVTYVIFETGSAPSRSQTRVDIPTFLVTSKLAYVGASFPKLVYYGNYVGCLGITAGGQIFATATVASMDSVIANDFKNEWPSVVTKTVITAATKAIIQAAIQKEAEDRGGMMAGLAAAVIMGGINAATNIADTRTWQSLPKEFQYARIPTPEGRTLILAAGAETQTVVLEPGAVNFVYVKSASPTAPLLVSTFVLK